MVDFTLTEEQEALKELARDFVERFVKPTAQERERIPDPRERFPWDLVEEGSRLGLRTLAAPRQYGGGGADCRSLCIVGEELAVGDLGVAVIFDQTWKFTRNLIHLTDEDQKQRFLVPFVQDHRYLLASALTEPSGGTDKFLPHNTPEANIQTTAVRDGDEYVINGVKHFISTGSEAKLYIVNTSNHRTKVIKQSMTALLVPAGTPGFRIGRIHNKIGQRLMNNAELIFENCRVPVANRLGPEGEYFKYRYLVVRESNAEAAATTIGVARAAYEASLSWARQRIQGGKPIIEHQLVGAMLADMLTKITVSRMIIWRAAMEVHHEPYDPKLPWMAKMFASEAAFEVCRMAMEIHGGYGIMDDLPIEKYLRDASTFLHSDGTNQLERLRIQNALIDEGR
jgi:acyl-CoA dehydrogenase